MSRLAKIVAWLAVVIGALTLGILVAALLRDPGLGSSTLVLWSVVGVAGIAAGGAALRGSRWAFWCLFVLYLVQLGDYWKPGFGYLSFMGPVAVNFGWGWSSPPSHFDINLLAVAVCVAALLAARGMASRSRGQLPGVRVGARSRKP